jgi:hypothetical protein
VTLDTENGPPYGPDEEKLEAGVTERMDVSLSFATKSVEPL